MRCISNGQHCTVSSLRSAADIAPTIVAGDSLLIQELSVAVVSSVSDYDCHFQWSAGTLKRTPFH
jgi:hypothetical protein